MVECIPKPRDSIHVYHKVALTEGKISLACEDWRYYPNLMFILGDGIIDDSFIQFYVAEIPLLIEALQVFAQKITADLEREPPNYG